MTSLWLMIVVVLLTFFFADSVFTPIVLLLWKKGSFLLLKIQALFTKKNVLQALVQSVVLTAKALLRLLNKAFTGWLLPLLLTRRQRYWLHFALLDAKRWVRFRLLRLWVRWRRQPLWFKTATIMPVVIVTLALFVLSGFLIAAMFGVTFVVPWLGGLPLATILFLRRQFAKAALYIFERLGLGPVVNKLVDGLIDLIWWRTPEPVQQRFDAWWRRMSMRLRRWVIGPRRKVVRRMSRLRFKQRETASEPASAGPAASSQPQTPPSEKAPLPAPER
jgi:hypothetical protein